MDIQRLRRETESDHQAVENVVPLMGNDLTTHEYIECLQQMYGVVFAWEERAAKIAPPWMQAVLVARQRKHLLELDLRCFGITEFDANRPALPAITDVPSLFGTMYVMEGSALGGQFIALHVERVLHLADGRGNAYFRGHGAQTGPLWKEFCDMMKVRVSDEQASAVIVSAKAMFATFGSWMREKSAIHAS